MMRSKNDANANEIIGLYRVPSLPHDFVNKIDTKSDLIERVSSTTFLEAIYIANPGFYTVLIDWLNGKYELNSKKELRVMVTAYKYLSRACHRSTPYGLFSKTFTSKIGFGTNISHNLFLPDFNGKQTDLDAIIIRKIISAVKADLFKQTQFRYFVNNSIVEQNGEIRYYNFEIKEDQFINYELTKIQSNEVLRETILFCQSDQPKTIIECANFLLSQFKSFNRQEITSYLMELVDANVLISNLDNCLLSKDPLNEIFVQLAGDDNKSEKWSKSVHQLITELNNNDKDIFQQERFTKEWLNAQGILLHSGANIFHVEHKVEQKDIVDIPVTYINQSLYGQLSEVRNLLDYLNNGVENNFKDFKEEFKRRYGNQDVLLLDVMDPLKGIGYALKNEDLYNLSELAGIKVSGRNNNNLTLTRFEQILHSELLENKEFIELDKLIEIGSFKPRANQVSKSVMAFTKIIDNGKKLFLREFTGISATRFLNRFTKTHPSLEAMMEQICQIENNNCQENQILAEFVHLPEIRMANLLKFDHRRKFQIGSIVANTNNKITNISLNDIYIQLIDGEFRLYSKSLLKEIIPTISNSLNPRAYPFNIYNFIYDLQGQKNNFDLYFRWGNLERLFHHLPRVVYKDIILSPAIWSINKQEISNEKEICNWKKKRKIPSQFYVGNSISSDELLYVNLDSELGTGVFLNELDRKGLLYVFEILEDNHFVSSKENSKYNHELLIPIVSNQSSVVKPMNRQCSSVKQRCGIEENWLYYKLYCSSIWAENFLKYDLKELIGDEEIKQNLKKWFFIRYQDDGGYHLRIRFNLNDFSDKGKFINKFNEFFNKYRESFQISRIVIDTYEREIDRYGFDNIIFCEKIFFYDSQNVLNILRNKIQDKFLVAIYGIDNYLNIFGFSEFDKENLLDSLSNSFFYEFNVDKKTREQMNMKYRSLADKIDGILNETNDEVDAIFQENTFLMKKEADQMQLTDEEVFGVVSSLIHMFLNRLLNSNPRYNEMFIYYNLAKQYRRTNKLRKITHV